LIRYLKPGEDVKSKEKRVCNLCFSKFSKMSVVDVREIHAGVHSLPPSSRAPEPQLSYSERQALLKAPPEKDCALEPEIPDQDEEAAEAVEEELMGASTSSITDFFRPEPTNASTDDMFDATALADSVLVNTKGRKRPPMLARKSAVSVPPFVVIRVIQALDVPKADTFTESDPLVKIWLEDEYGTRKSEIKSTLARMATKDPGKTSYPLSILLPSIHYIC
jgi:hypothetical protein